MANSGVNFKIGVSGVAQFKQNMKQAQTSVKTLDEQLKLNEKQFKATGDAEEYMKTKSELLKKKIEEQKGVVAQAEKAMDAMTKNGVDRSSKSFQEMQQQLLRARGVLVDAEADLNKVSGAAESAAWNVIDMNSNIENIGKQISYKTVTDGIDTITGKLEKAALKAWEIGSQLVRNTLGGGSWADELNTEAAKLEISPEKLYRMRQTSDIIDTSAESIAEAQNKMKKALDGGGSGIADVLQELGLSTAIETDPEEEFWKIGEALMAMGDAYDKEGAAQKVFGRSWRELIPLFQAGREEYEKTMASWSWVGDDSFNSLLKMDDQYQKLQNEWETFQHTMEAALAGPMTTGMEVLTDLVKEFNSYLDSEKGQEMLKQLGDTANSLISSFTSVDPEQIMEKFQGAFDAIINGLQWLETNKDNVVEWLKGILKGWAVLKISGTALDLINFFKGIKGITGTSASAIAAAGKTAGSTFASNFSGAFVSAAPALAGLLGLGAAGYAGAKMIEANLNDENLNQIYGHDGESGLIDNLTPAMTEAIAKYWDIYKNESMTGTEAAFAARDTLQQMLQEAGYHNDEQGVGLIENIFENMLKGTDPDGLSSKLAMAIASVGVPKIVSMVYEAQSKAQRFTEAHRAAAEEWWDTYRANPSGDNINAAYAKFQQAFEGNEDLFTKLDAMIDQYMQDNNGLNDSAWRNIEDLPSWMFATPQGSGGNSELPSAINNLNGLPGSISKAVVTGMDGIRLYIDGQAAGRIIGPWMRQDMADLVLEMTQ